MSGRSETENRTLVRQAAVRQAAREPHLPAYHGGPGWEPRAAASQAEIGSIWASLRVASEVEPLRAVLLHRPGAELAAVRDPAAALLAGPLDGAVAAAQHDALAAAYAAAGVTVHRVDPPGEPPPNQMFVADLFFMTPAGAILARPAAAARAGEERWVARRLADLGVPILCSVAGSGTFEGADAMWLDEGTVLIGRGLRTNAEGAAQVAAALATLGIDVAFTDMPVGTMHLMGQLRILDADLAVYWPGRLAADVLDALRHRGIVAHPVPDIGEAAVGHALNIVTLAPRRILMPAGNPGTEAFFRAQGVECTTVAMTEVHRAAGSIGCLTGVLHRG